MKSVIEPLVLSEMSDRLRHFDWAHAQVPPLERWPAELLLVLKLVLNSASPAYLGYGNEMFFFYNDAYREILGDKHPSAFGQPMCKVWYEAWNDVEPIQSAALRGEVMTMRAMPFRVYRFGRLEETHFTFCTSPVHLANGTVGGVYCSAQETGAATSAKPAETAAAYWQRVRSPVDRAITEWAAGDAAAWHKNADLLSVLRADGSFLASSPSWAQTLGWNEAELVGRSALDLIHADDRLDAAESFAGLLHGATVMGQAWRFRHRDGSYRWLSWNSSLFEGRIVSTSRDITYNTIQLQLYRDIVEASTAPICAFDLDHRIIAFNKAHDDAFRNLFGRPVELGEVFPDAFPVEHAAILRAYMARALRGEAYTVVERFGATGTDHPVWELSYCPLRNADNDVIGAFHQARDISARLRTDADMARLQETLRQSQKMEAVGQLTGGLAHDFNNLLAGISGSLDLILLRARHNEGDDLKRYIGIAKNGVKRAAALTHRLLAFSRRQTLAPRATDVVRLMDGMRELIDRTAGPSIQVEVVHDDALWLVMVDQPQLENALLNLCINARDAMPDGGRISIRLANQTFDASAASQHELEPGQYLSLCIGDTGMGMTPEVIRRAVEPFFTTKPIGEGTGLGLSMVYGFAQQSGGQLHIASTPGQGTDIRLYLPRYLGAPGDGDVVAESRLPSGRFSETVMVVDDEDSVRIILRDVLENLGFEVIEAADSISALKLLQSNASIDFLVTDVGLPGGMNGRQVADAARIVRPELGVLFITGYAEKTVFGNTSLPLGMSVITKPFDLGDVVTQIGTMLAQRGQDRSRQA